jgi:hypothetical protein
VIAGRPFEHIRARGTPTSRRYTYPLTPQTATPGDMPVKPLREDPARVRMPTHFHPLPQSWPGCCSAYFGGSPDRQRPHPPRQAIIVGPT